MRTRKAGATPGTVFGACALLAVLSACTMPPVAAHDMAPMADVMETIESNPALQDAIQIGEVTVSEEASTSRVAPISADAVRETLRSALLSAHMANHAGETGPYLLDARMTRFTAPGWGFRFEVPCDIDYTLTRLSDRTVVYHDVIRQVGTAGMGDAFEGADRARIAMASAVRENVTHLVRVLGALPLPADRAHMAKTSAAPYAMTEQKIFKTAPKTVAPK